MDFQPERSAFGCFCLLFFPLHCNLIKIKSRTDGFAFD